MLRVLFFAQTNQRQNASKLVCSISLLFVVLVSGCGGNDEAQTPSSPHQVRSKQIKSPVDPAPPPTQDEVLKKAQAQPTTSDQQTNVAPVEAKRPVVVPFAPRFTRQPTVRPNPNRNAPLVAVVEFETSEPVSVELIISDAQQTWTAPHHDSLKQQHDLVVLGFRPARKHRIQIRLQNAVGESLTMREELSFTTESLPDDFPPLKVSVSEPDRMEPGITLFNVMQWKNDQANENLGQIVAIDHAGEVVWYFRTDHPISELRRLQNGNLLYLRAHRDSPLTAAIEIDMLGNVVTQWYAAGIVPQIPADAIPVDIDTFHHVVYELQSGNLLGIGTELRKLQRFPTSETRRVSLKPANVVGDVLVEFRRDGSVVKKWKLLDLLDTTRIGYGSLSGFWDTRIYRDVPAGTKDWSHSNSIVCDENEEWILLSIRHQDAVVKLNKQTGQFAWILSVPTGWQAPWKKFLLKPEGKLDWPYHQHAPRFTPDGTILMYDNGNYRARPPRQKTPGYRSRSRVVEFAVDEENMTVRQVWEYRGKGKDAFFSPLFGDADWLPQTGNVLITDGARMLDKKGRPDDAIPGAHQWARILEVTHTTPAKKVFEIILDSGPDSNIGWSIYRSERLPGL